MLPTKFRFIWLGSFRGEDFLDIIGLFENAMKKAEAVFVSETPRF
jgi:hypothetical protein